MVMQLFQPSLISRFGCAAVLLAALALTSCSGSPAPRDNYYRLAEPADVPARTGGPLPGAAEVVPLRADGLLNDRAIIFQKGPTVIEGYSYHFWWQAPGSMLQQSMIDTLRRAQAFEQVAGPEMKLNRVYDVVGRIRRMEQGSNNVVVELELSLRLARGGEPLLLKTYTEEVPTTGNGIPAAVDAFSTAVARIMNRFVSDLGMLKPLVVSQ